MQEYTGFEPKMWGPSIIGFGVYHYKSDRSKQEGDWPLVGFLRVRLLFHFIFIWVMIMDYCLDSVSLPWAKSCIYVKKLSDIDVEVMKEDDGYYN